MRRWEDDYKPLLWPADGYEPLYGHGQYGVERPGEGDLGEGQQEGDQVREHLGELSTGGGPGEETPGEARAGNKMTNAIFIHALLLFSLLDTVITLYLAVSW